MKRLHKRSIILITALLLFLFFLTDGVVLCKDSQGYLNMSLGREAGYSLFLHAFFMIFGETFFARAAVLFQIVLWGVAICLLTFAMEKLWSLNSVQGFVIWGIQIAFLLLLKFGSGLGAVYANTLLTEGLTYPLYFLFFKAACQLNVSFTKKRMAEMLGYCALLMLIRTQLAVTFMAVAIFWLLKAFFRRTSWKQWGMLATGCILGMLLVTGAEKGYTFLVHGVASGPVGSSSFLLTTGLYEAEESDAELYTEPEERQLFEALYHQVQEKKAGASFAESKGFLPKPEHYSQNFDVIKFEITSPFFYNYLRDQGITDETQILLKLDQMSRKLGLPLVKKHLGAKLWLTAQECIRGAMRSIAKCNRLLAVPVVLLYLLYMVLMIVAFRAKKTENTGWCALFLLIVMAGNIAATALMIFCEPRYVLYNMVPFYSMEYVMLVDCLRKRKAA